MKFIKFSYFCLPFAIALLLGGCKKMSEEEVTLEPTQKASTLSMPSASVSDGTLVFKDETDLVAACQEAGRSDWKQYNAWCDKLGVKTYKSIYNTVVDAEYKTFMDETKKGGARPDHSKAWRDAVAQGVLVVKPRGDIKDLYEIAIHPYFASVVDENGFVLAGKTLIQCTNTLLKIKNNATMSDKSALLSATTSDPTMNIRVVERATDGIVLGEEAGIANKNNSPNTVNVIIEKKAKFRTNYTTPLMGVTSSITTQQHFLQDGELWSTQIDPQNSSNINRVSMRIVGKSLFRQSAPNSSIFYDYAETFIECRAWKKDLWGNWIYSNTDFYFNAPRWYFYNSYGVASSCSGLSVTTGSPNAQNCSQFHMYHNPRSSNGNYGYSQSSQNFTYTIPAMASYLGNTNPPGFTLTQTFFPTDPNFNPTAFKMFFLDAAGAKTYDLKCNVATPGVNYSWINAISYDNW
jgi:hypothetical protein